MHVNRLKPKGTFSFTKQGCRTERLAAAFGHWNCKHGTANMKSVTFEIKALLRFLKSETSCLQCFDSSGAKISTTFLIE